MSNVQTRTHLQSLFKTGAKPSEEDFKALIDSSINILDDAVGKPAGEGLPFAIGVQGDDKNLLDFQDGDTHLWRFQQYTDDSNTGLHLSTGGQQPSTRLFVESSSGKTGIGTTTPAAQLHIQQIVDQDTLRISTLSGQSQFVVDQQGKVGVGSEPGEQELKVSGSAEITGTVNVKSSGSTFAGNVGIGTISPNIHLAIGDKDTGLKQQGDGKLAIYTNNDEKVRIDKSGKVGIGTTDPKTKLHVSGGELRIQAVDSEYATNIAQFYADNGKQGVGIGYNRITAIGSDANHNIRLEPKGTGKIVAAGALSVSGTSHLTNSVGVGIEPDSAHKLTVYAGEMALKTDDNEKDQGILFQNSGNAYTWRIYRSDAGNSHADLRFASGLENEYGNLMDRMAIDKEGKVGIGINSPSKKLHIEAGELRTRASHNNGTADIGTFYSNNLIQGLGIGYNKIAAIGSNTNQDIGLHPKGTGKVSISTSLAIAKDADISRNLLVNGSTITKGDLTVSGSNMHLPGHIYLRRHSSTTPVAFLQAREDSQNVDIDMRFRTQLKGNSSRKIVEAMTITARGRVGIGTTNPTKAKVQIEGGVDSAKFVYGYLNKTKPAGTDTNTRGTNNYSLYANSRIASSEFNAHSDIRIKNVKGRSNAQADLEILQKIEVSDYTLKDTIANDNRVHKKVIGQQIAKVFPQAVSCHANVVPDIFSKAEASEGWIELKEHTLKVGDRIQIILPDTDPQLYTIEAIQPNRIRVNLTHEGPLFIYGREVNDFHVVDYDALSMLNISATQALCQTVDTLKAEVQQLKKQLLNSRDAIATS
ncbi:MAG: tail fiber domain-containing protein [Cyanobacteria bacterium J06621_11]